MTDKILTEYEKWEARQDGLSLDSPEAFWAEMGWNGALERLKQIMGYDCTTRQSTIIKTLKTLSTIDND